jgi:hypothetical protein
MSTIQSLAQIKHEVGRLISSCRTLAGLENERVMTVTGLPRTKIEQLLLTVSSPDQSP